jgi:hypothetical protein
MTPKEKALNLFYKYNSQTSNEFKSDSFTSAKTAKECALICVDEILKVAFYSTDEIYNFYIEVKQEIEKL